MNRHRGIEPGVCKLPEINPIYETFVDPTLKPVPGGMLELKTNWGKEVVGGIQVTFTDVSAGEARTE